MAMENTFTKMETGMNPAAFSRRNVLLTYLTKAFADTQENGRKTVFMVRAFIWTGKDQNTKDSGRMTKCTATESS